MMRPALTLLVGLIASIALGILPPVVGVRGQAKQLAFGVAINVSDRVTLPCICGNAWMPWSKFDGAPRFLKINEYQIHHS